MEIFTLLKANMLKKKGTFISIMILMLLITAMMISVISVKYNYNKAIDNSFDTLGSDVLVMIRKNNLSDELLAEVENHEYVEKVDKYISVGSNHAIYNGWRDNNGYFFRELPDNIKVYNDKANGFLKEKITINPGEIYLPLGSKDKIKCKLGTSIEIVFNDEISKTYKIAGFVEEPYQGASTIGWKQVFINSNDLIELQNEIGEERKNNHFYVLEIFKKDDCSLSSIKFQRQVNLDTKIISMSIGSIYKDQSKNYATMIPEIVINVVIGFSILLFVIVMIVISHNISTEIEMDYTTLGILKSQGFTKNKIRLLYLLQYIISIIVGILIGLLGAIPIEIIVGNVCKNITGILPNNGINFIAILLYTIIVLAISSLILYLKTIKIGKVSPVNAINGGNNDIYFNNRLNAPISKKRLSLSLSFRQFTSAIKRYISTILIAALLVFCMITTTLVSKCLSSKETLRNMGVVEADITLVVKDKEGFEGFDEADSFVEATGYMLEKNSIATLYTSIEGENVMCEILEFSKYIEPSVLKGRAPLYDNEIVVSKFVADELDLSIGEEATVTFGKNSNQYLITGIYQSGSDGGYVYAMSFDGAIRNGATITNYLRYYVLNDRDKIEEVAGDLANKFGDKYTITYDISSSSNAYSAYKSIVDIVNIIIYSFSIIFTLVVIKMICTKAFIEEKTSFGIYKALGFTNKKLRLQFSLRFLVISIIGSLIGVILSLLFTDDLLNLIFSLFGICKVSFVYTPLSIILPFVTISACLFVFAYLLSGKIKKCDARELIAEV